MVPTPLRSRVARAARIAAAGAISLTLAACRGAPDAGQGASIAERVAAMVRAEYGDRDAVAAGAWTWDGPDSIVWVLVDVQSTVPGLVQARVDLWAGDTTAVVRMARSDVMPSTAEFGAYAFEDATGDGMPDLLGYVADSAGVTYPVFLPGARGAMSDMFEDASRGWRFLASEDAAPSLVRGPSGACAVRVWAEEPPDGAAAGWRYLALRRGGELGAPAAEPPACP